MNLVCGSLKQHENCIKIIIIIIFLPYTGYGLRVFVCMFVDYFMLFVSYGLDNTLINARTIQLNKTGPHIINELFMARRKMYTYINNTLTNNIKKKINSIKKEN